MGDGKILITEVGEPNLVGERFLKTPNACYDLKEVSHMTDINTGFNLHINGNREWVQYCDIDEKFGDIVRDETNEEAFQNMFGRLYMRWVIAKLN